MRLGELHAQIQRRSSEHGVSRHHSLSFIIEQNSQPQSNSSDCLHRSTYLSIPNPQPMPFGRHPILNQNLLDLACITPPGSPISRQDQEKGKEVSLDEYDQSIGGTNLFQ